LPSRSTQTSKTPRYVGDPLICRRAAQWLACWAPNPKICGSKPRFAMPNASATGICPRRGCAQQAIARAQARPDIPPRGKHDTKPVCPSSAHRRRRFPHLRRPRKTRASFGAARPHGVGPQSGNSQPAAQLGGRPDGVPGEQGSVDATRREDENLGTRAPACPLNRHHARAPARLDPVGVSPLGRAPRPTVNLG
jgi:hypothetical protein